MLANPGVMQEYAAAGTLRPIDPALDQQTMSRQYGSGWLQLMQATGPSGAKAYYAIIVKAALKSVIWYNPDQFPARYLKILKSTNLTWSQLVGLTHPGSGPGAFPPEPANRTARRQDRHSNRVTVLWPANHDFRRLDKSHGFFARLQGEFPHRICRDDGRNPLASDGENHFSEQPVNGDLDYCPQQLVAPADAGCACMRAAMWQKLVQGLEGNAMVSPGSFHRPDPARQDPVLDGRITDAEFLGSLSRRKKRGRGHGPDLSRTVHAPTWFRSGFFARVTLLVSM